jgi:hypothetical protein
MAGPQDLTITDGATDQVRRMWIGLGGQPLAHAAIDWLKVIRPGATGKTLLDERGGRAMRWATRISEPAMDVALRTVLRRRGWLFTTESAATSEPLTANGLVKLIGEAGAWLRFHVDYDVDYAHWLFQELETVDFRGVPIRRVVRDGKDRIAGWYLYLLVGRGIAQVLQVAAPAENLRLVLADMLCHAAAGGAVAVRGRVEPSLIGELHAQRCVYLRTDWALVHSRDQTIMAMLGSPKSLLTRLDGEWWMGHRLLWRDHERPQTKKTPKPPGS